MITPKQAEDTKAAHDEIRRVQMMSIGEREIDSCLETGQRIISASGRDWVHYTESLAERYRDHGWEVSIGNSYTTHFSFTKPDLA